MKQGEAALAATGDRAHQRAAFLKRAGWGGALAAPMTGDASTRSYERLTLGSRGAILMNAPRGAETSACPPNAGIEERKKLGYNALARLAGPNLNAFTSIALSLREAGLSAPDIYAADADLGFAIIEDLGDALYAKAIPEGADEDELYATAIDALVALRRAAPTPPQNAAYSMLAYDRAAMEAEVALLIDWYWAHKSGDAPSDALRSEYLDLWGPVLDKLPAPSLMVLRDFHAENLLWLPDRKGVARVGVIDFQDGLVGNPAYDLVSLLEDARRDVDERRAEALIVRYARAASDIAGFDEAAFRRDYAILGAQRNAKILGIFARLIRRDNKPRYAQFFPRVEAHFRRDLSHPELRPVADFMRAHFGDVFP